MADRIGDPEPGGQSSSAPGWGKDPLGFLIAPADRKTFLAEHYERAPLIALRGEPDRYSDLLTLDSLDHFLASADLHEGMVDLTDHHDPVSRDSFIDESGRISRVAVAEHYLRGSTIILPHLHDSMYNLGEFCRSLEEVFSCHVQTNIYLTPASNRDRANQGFPPHYDNHDVFVMQVSGAKQWRLYDTPIDIPYRGEGFEPGRHEPGESTGQFTLNSGDCLYLPRGLMHDAANVGDEPSLHITVGLITKTWADLILESISELALSEQDFRKSLPLGFAARDFDRDEALRRFKALTCLIAEKASLDSAFDLLADNFVRGRRADISGVIASGAVADGDPAQYRRRRFLPWNVAEDEGQLVLIVPGGDLRFDQEDGDALDVALSGEAFAASDLVCAEPGRLLHRLWAAGLLERIAP